MILSVGASTVHRGDSQRAADASTSSRLGKEHDVSANGGTEPSKPWATYRVSDKLWGALAGRLFKLCLPCLGSSTGSTPPCAAQSTNVETTFVASDKFKGSIEGWAFKMGPLGLGYYDDSAPPGAPKSTAAEVAAILTGAPADDLAEVAASLTGTPADDLAEVAADGEASASAAIFVASDRFKGPIEGWAFKMGSLGLGYYDDSFKTGPLGLGYYDDSAPPGAPKTTAAEVAAILTGAPADDLAEVAAILTGASADDLGGMGGEIDSELVVAQSEPPPRQKVDWAALLGAANNPQGTDGEVPVVDAADGLSGMGGEVGEEIVVAQSRPPPDVAADDLAQVTGKLQSMARDVSSAANTTVSSMWMRWHAGTCTKMPGQPLDERLRQRLRRISEAGALAVLDKKDEDEQEPATDAKLDGLVAEVRAATEKVQRVMDELKGLTATLNGFMSGELGEACKQANDLQNEVTLIKGSAHVPDANAMSDDALQRHWSKGHGALPEYRCAADAICLRSEWMCSTLMGRHVAQMQRHFQRELDRFVANPAIFQDVLEELIWKAYRLRGRTAARAQQDILSDSNVLDRVTDVHNSLEAWKKPLFGVALQVMLDLEEDSNAIVSKLTEVVDHSLHCQQVKVKGFQVAMAHSARLLERLSSRRAAGCTLSSDLDEALTRVYACFQDYVDDHKERAFSASFIEPALFYASHTSAPQGSGGVPFGGVPFGGGQMMIDNVEPHAINWYLALLNAALGAHLPRQATYSDDFAVIVCDFWLGLKDECWQHFSDPEHFGKSWQGIPALKRGGESLVRKKVRSGHLPHDKEVGCGKAKVFANSAVDPFGDEGQRRVLSLYLERFAHFFSRDFFIRRAFEVLNAEGKPEHTGFRKACDTLFQCYRRKHPGISEETLVEYCYRDDPYFTRLDVGRTESFLAWLQVVKAPQPKASANEKDKHCEGCSCSCQPRFLYHSFDEGVARLVAMGFGAEQANEAWQACLGSTEAAMGVLLGEGVPPHGLPEGEEPPQPPGPQCHQQ